MARGQKQNSPPQTSSKSNGLNIKPEMGKKERGAARGCKKKLLKARVGGNDNTHIDCNMTHDALMMRQANVLFFMVNTICINGTSRSWFVLLDDKSTLDIDLDRPGVADDGLVQATGTSVRRELGRAGSRHLRRWFSHSREMMAQDASRSLRDQIGWEKLLKIPRLPSCLLPSGQRNRAQAYGVYLLLAASGWGERLGNGTTAVKRGPRAGDVLEMLCTYHLVIQRRRLSEPSTPRQHSSQEDCESTTRQSNRTCRLPERCLSRDTLTACAVPTRVYRAKTQKMKTFLSPCCRSKDPALH